jgi:putative FmdB family regulatory protein
MPIYDYSCKNAECKLEFECSQSIKDKTLSECPNCTQKSLQRGVGGGIAIIIKTDTPTNLGSLAEKNSENILKNKGRLPYNSSNPDPQQVPWWRKTESGKALPLDFKVLRNPDKYIETGVK